jgi:hypothetical protein
MIRESSSKVLSNCKMVLQKTNGEKAAQLDIYRKSDKCCKVWKRGTVMMPSGM